MVYKIKPRPFICLGIILVSVLSGIFFSNLIRKGLQKDSRKFEKCILIKDTIRFTSLRNGEFIAEGKLKAKDPQSWALPGLPGKYLEIRIVQEEYRSHTRVRPVTDGKGNTHTTVETYHSWDAVKTHTLISDSLIFLGRTFGIGDINFSHHLEYKTTTNDARNLRTVYYVHPEETEVGILQGVAKNGRMSELVFKEGKTIESEKSRHIRNQRTVPGWFLGIWIFFGLVLTIGVYIDDRLWE